MFYTTHIGPLPTDSAYRRLTYQQFLDRLMMFVSYCAIDLKCNIRSIPGIMSTLRWQFVARVVDYDVFDDDLLKFSLLHAKNIRRDYDVPI